MLTGNKRFKDMRPEFQRMLSDARAGKFNLIIVKSISRFARNTETMLNTVRELKERWALALYFNCKTLIWTL